MDVLKSKKRVQIADVTEMAKDPGFVQSCEDTYTARVHAAAEAVLDSGARVVLLTGPSASGKTTSTKRIQQEIERMGTPVTVLSLDDFLFDAATYPRLPNGMPDYESDQTINMELFNSSVNKLLSEGECDLPTYDWGKQKSVAGEHATAEPGSIIMAEGIHALNPRASSGITAGKVFKIYASIRTEFYEGKTRVLNTREIRIVRRLVRDTAFRSCPVEDTLEMWNNILRGEELYIKPYAKYADYVFDTSFLSEIPVFSHDFHEIYKDPKNGGKHRETLEGLYKKYAMFPSLPEELLPDDSMLREFLGGLRITTGQ